MTITKILVATDFSSQSQQALAHALGIARRTGAELVLVYVSPVIEEAYQVPGRDWVRVLAEHVEITRSKLAEVRASLRGEGVTVSQAVVDDDPDHGIIKAAGELGCDLIALGTHGHTGIRRVLLGSVAERVIRYSEVSVLVTRGQDPAAGGYQRILVPTDFSAGAEQALAMACSLVRRGGTIDVRHYWNEPVFGPVIEVGEVAETLHESTSMAGIQLIERHRSDDYEIQFVASGGLPVHEILDQLDRERYDLVVMGSHGRRGLRRWLLGSVAEATARHAPCSVLVVKETGAA